MTTPNYVTLNRTEDKMPLIGIACSKMQPEYVEETIYDAIKDGFRLIDSASDNGNEVQVGRGINRAIKEGIVKREELFGKLFVTKLWSTYRNKNRVRAAFDKQLKDLNLEYVDLYMIHYPVPLKFRDFNDSYPPGWHDSTGRVEFESSPMHECWPELEKLADAKLARKIGVANFSIEFLLDLLTYAKIKPAVFQAQIHPYLQQSSVVNWVQSQGIQVTTCSPLGPTSYDVLAYSLISPVYEHRDIRNIAFKHNKTPSHVLLRWSIEKRVAVILSDYFPPAAKPYLDLFSWPLDSSDMEIIFKVEQDLRINDPYYMHYQSPPVFSRFVR